MLKRIVNVPRLSAQCSPTLLSALSRPFAAMPAGTEAEPRFLEMVKVNFDKASKVAKLDKDISEVIKACNSLLRVNFPLRRDDGSIEVSVAAVKAGGVHVAARARSVGGALAKRWRVADGTARG